MLRTNTTAAALLAITALTTLASTTSADTIHKQLQKQIPTVVDYLNDHNLKTIGVLKFRVKKPGQKTSDSVGPLNSLLADRLEVGLILGNPFDEARQLSIIKDASAQAAEIDGANHLTDDGRAALFGPEFTLAWGKDKQAADAFLTGVVQVNDDKETVTVGILCFTSAGDKLEKVGETFQAELDAGTLAELGQTFIVRGAFDQGATKLTFQQNQDQKQLTAVKAAKRINDEELPFPLAQVELPVKLSILYDGQPMTVETRDGQAFVAEPRRGQNVEFLVARQAAKPARYAVALKVNGENTLYRQTQRDLDCAKWILSPEHPETLIRGYQMRDKKTAEKFEVLSQSESAARAIDYGRHVGQIQMTVYEELGELAPTLPSELSDDEEDLLAILRGVQPAKLPTNLGAAKTQIRLATRGGGQSRGLIVQGSKTDNKVRSVKFEPDPTPVMSITITYYQP